jgi:hypothetical protein
MSIAQRWNNNINNTDMEKYHQQHEAGTTTSSTTQIWNNIINDTKLEHRHLYVARE